MRLSGNNSITSYDNIGENLSVGFNYYGSIKVGDANLRAGFNLYTYQTTSDDLGRVLFNWNMEVIRYGQRIKAETFGFFDHQIKRHKVMFQDFQCSPLALRKILIIKKGLLA